MLRSIQLLCALLFFVSLCERVTAQDFDLYRNPGQGLSGNAATELKRIRNRDIGNNFTGSQINRQSINRASIGTPNVGGYTGRTVVGGINRSSGDLGLGGGPARKPFEGASRGPTVSPYLNLFRDDFDGSSDFNYQTLVRPQLQQQQMNQDLQRQQLETNQRIQSLSARQDYAPQGSQSMMPTGHTATFRYHSHFYPTMGQTRRGR